MKKLKIVLLGKKYEIELQNGFYEYIKEDINRLNSSSNQIKELLNLFLKEKSLSYENEKKVKKMLKKFEI